MVVKWRVDELAERKGWNARRLAEKAGVDIKTARNILTGRATRVDLETIGRLADALGVEPGDLWRRTQTAERIGGPPPLEQQGLVQRKKSIGCCRGVWDVDTDPALERATRPE